MVSLVVFQGLPNPECLEILNWGTEVKRSGCSLSFSVNQLGADAGCLTFFQNEGVFL